MSTRYAEWKEAGSVSDLAENGLADLELYFRASGVTKGDVRQISLRNNISATSFSEICTY